MGTNYYVSLGTEKVICSECEQTYVKPIRLHIGKSSYGHPFVFTNHCLSVEDWFEYLKDKVIMDEYGYIVDIKNFSDVVLHRVIVGDIETIRGDSLVYYKETPCVISKTREEWS